jgi:predicted TIM-barrel enzyme
MAGRVSLTGLFAYGDANSVMLEMADEVLPMVKNTPVLAGVNGTDPFRQMTYFLKYIKEMGFSGVQNFPTVGLFDGKMRANMEACGLGYDKEVDMIGTANKLDLLTTPYCFNREEAKEMVNAGADIIVAHVGLTTGGSIGAADSMTLEQAVEVTMDITETARSQKKDIFVLCHGGPFDEPENVAAALKQMPGIDGFYGASSIERLPVEKAITEQVRKFKKIKLD